ncbi:hypothetical protein CPT03_07050 [Pedobacter ginsengisoli]|uniref:Uncharacterized protein n=1 Tax=Pedobacter ginsengisoli TaxID=363852 RepID=A0A2D1U3Q9_9SPHI|nr:hypothetical protein [Pedobacter ginsengisoli]ATP56242.1 hypothetical protein CPT03_07050 [Pedobacter ginsengisoli]
MKKIYALVSLLLLIFLGQTKAQTAKQLEKAYQKKSTVKLKAFFDDWAKDLPPATPEQRSKMSNPVQQAYQVFEAFYNPHDLGGRGGSEFGNKIYEGFNYLIIQDKFKIYQKEKVFYTDEEAKAYAIDSIKKNVERKYHEKWIASIESGDKYFVNAYGPNNRPEWDDKGRTLIDSVTDFRPNIVGTKGTPLYLSDKYKALLDNFLGNKHVPFATGGIMNTAQAKDESADRQKFLQNYIKIFYGHWGGYWQYPSYPTISSIVFDKDLKYVKVYYGMIYEGGEAFLKLENNAWKLLSMKRTWIQ